MHEFIYSLMTDRRRGFGAGVLKFFLFVLSILFLFAVVLRRFLYKFGVISSYRLTKPVISVGNVTLGGSGKTPLVLYLAQKLREKEKRPAVLMRGYMPKGNDAHKTIKSDEAQLFRKMLPDVPVGVGPDRLTSAKRLLSEHDPDLFIMDDGYQHWRIRRNADIVVIDATNPFGNGHLIPRGILREPLYSLRRAHFFVLTKSDLGHENVRAIESKLNRINLRAPVFQAVHRPLHFQDVFSPQRFELSKLNKKTAVSFCAIGDPQSFQKSLTGLGVELKKEFVFRDHHIYSHQDVQEMIDCAQKEGAGFIITTSKDAVKLKDLKDLHLGEIKLVYLQIALQIKEREDEFIDRLSSILDG